MREPRPWWQDAVIYQIYPWSFADGDGDGVGDLVGAAARLPYVASLGVDAVWVCPIYPTGRADWGYDVTDYRGVDPLFGGTEAFDRFLAEAHRLGLRLLLDFVPNHTSNRHPWFVEASSSRDSPRRDWYIWADGRDDGREPPNNWESSFGGSTWQWHEPTGQWHLASFFPEQCDLNWRNPAVRAEVIGAMRFWVDRGAEGFRIDVVQRLGKDRLLRDNPGAPEVDRMGQVRRHRVYEEDRPEVHDYLREIRAALARGCASSGRCGCSIRRLSTAICGRASSTWRSTSRPPRRSWTRESWPTRSRRPNGCRRPWDPGPATTCRTTISLGTARDSESIRSGPQRSWC